MFSNQRLSGKGVEICIYVNSCYQVSVVDCNIHIELFEHHEVKLNSPYFSTTVFLSAVYRPPNKSLHLFVDEFSKCLENFSHLSLSFCKIIAGDFNVNLLQIDTNDLVSSFIDNIHCECFFPSIHWPTRITSKSATFIDNIFLHSFNILILGLIYASFSDHLPVFTDLNLKKLVDHSIINNASNINQYKRIYTDEGYNKLSYNLPHCNWDFILDTSNISNDYNNFLRQFQLHFNAFFPPKIRINRDHLKYLWMTKAILVSSKHKNKL